MGYLINIIVLIKSGEVLQRSYREIWQKYFRKRWLKTITIG
jgi:hypothetical protein